MERRVDRSAEVRRLREMIDARTLFAERVVGERPVFTRCLWHPDRGRPNLAVYRDHCYCFVCHKWEGVLGLVAAIEGLDILREFPRVLEAARRLAGTSSSLRPSSRPAAAPEGPAAIPSLATVERWHRALLGGSLKERQEWLLRRGILVQTLISERIGHTGKAFVIPVWDDRHQNILTLRFRRDDALAPSAPKYWGLRGSNGTLLYNAHLLSSLRGERVILCEGELDALRLSQEGLCAVSFTNGAAAGAAAAVGFLRDVEAIIVAYDADEAGYLRGLEIAKALAPRARLARWHPADGKDVTEFIQRNGLGAFLTVLERARPIRPVEQA